MSENHLSQEPANATRIASMKQFIILFCIRIGNDTMTERRQHVFLEGHRMLGLPRGEVFLIPWTETWSKAFLLEKERIHNKHKYADEKTHFVKSIKIHLFEPTIL